MRQIDTANREIILASKEKCLNGDTIRLDDVVDMQGDIFSGIESGLFDTVWNNNVQYKRKQTPRPITGVILFALVCGGLS